jgi:hypothetical protein
MSARIVKQSPPVQIDDVSLFLIADALAHLDPQFLVRLERFLDPERYELLCLLVRDASEVERAA